jgi:hypothetical protein
MSLDRFYNKLSILQSSARNIGQTLESVDLKSISYELGILENIQDNFLDIEAHFYNLQGDYLTSQYTVPYKYSTVHKDFLFDIPSLFDVNNLLSGTYKVSFAFLINLFGNVNNAPFFLHEISPDRTELKLRVKLSYVNVYPDIVTELQQFRDIAANLKVNEKLNNISINFGSNNIFQIVNVKIQCDDDGNLTPCQSENEQNCSDLVVYFKLQYPLPLYVQEKQFCFISFKVLEDYIDTFSVQQAEPQPIYTTLRGPRFENCISVETSNSTELKSWNELLDTDTVTYNSLIRSILSGSEQIPLNIDYTDFKNFVTYGSATERLKNYNYKRQLIEFFEAQSKTASLSNASASFYVEKLTDNYTRRSNLILTELDDFEKYLHYNTGSIFTHDITGSIVPAPKYVYSSSLYNYPTTSSQYTQWYDQVLEKASKHDFRNYDSFYYNTPDHILRDPNNSEYITFLHMMGQHFDNIYMYVRELTSIHRRDEHPERGIPNKLLPYYARSLGWKIQNTKQLSDLWLYKLGVNSQGQSSDLTGSFVTKAHENLNNQIWRRIVNNLPSLLKTKGSERSIRALFSIYGIPYTLISVKEYGGPKMETVTLDDTPNIAQDRFHYFLNFKGDQYIQLPRNLVSSSISSYTQVPQTVEFRFKTNYTGSVSMSLWAIEENSNRSNVLHNLELVHYQSQLYGVNTYGYLKYTAATGSAGDLSYITVTGSLLPYYDNDPWTVRIYSDEAIRPNGSFNGQLKIESGKASDFVDSRVSLSSSMMLESSTGNSMLYSLGADNVLNSTPHYVVIGGTTGSFSTRFSGSIHSYKEYFSSYTKEVFLEHILNPGSYHTNYYTGSYKELYRYFPLGIDNLKFDHSIYTQVSSSQPNRVISSGTTGSFFNFTGLERQQYSPATELYYQYIPSIGANVPRSNKVRIEKSYLSDNLSPTERTEISRFDKSPRDSNRLAIVFSPTDQINRDIANQFGPYNFENFIGDPQDGPKVLYPDLDKARDEYFKKFNKANDIGKYIEIFSLYDYTVFSQLRQLVPARANLIAGVLIEPSLLERPKIKRTFPTITPLGESTVIDTAITDISSSYIPPYQGVLPFPYIPEIERSKEEVTIPILLIPEVDREKHIIDLPVKKLLEIDREKKEVSIIPPIDVEFKREKEILNLKYSLSFNSYNLGFELTRQLSGNSYSIGGEKLDKEINIDLKNENSIIQLSADAVDRTTVLKLKDYNILESKILDLKSILNVENSNTKISFNYIIYTTSLSIKDATTQITFSYNGNNSLNSNTPQTYLAELRPLNFTANLLENQSQIVNSFIKDVTNTFSYISNGNVKTITILDKKVEQLSGTSLVLKSKTPYTRNLTYKIGSFKVKLLNTSVYLDFQLSYLQTNSYVFEFESIDVAGTKTLVGTKFAEFLNLYNYQVYTSDENIYKFTESNFIPCTVITGSINTPTYSKFETYFSSSGIFTPGVTSPLMLTSPVYLNSRTGSFKSKYDREVDYSTNKSIGAYYSSSLKPVNYQHFENSRIGGMRFAGSKLQGPGINQNSSATVNGTPVVIVTLIEDNPIRL